MGKPSYSIHMSFLYSVREKAKALVSLLKDKERLKEERERAKQARQRLHGEGSGISSDFGRAKPRTYVHN